MRRGSTALFLISVWLVGAAIGTASADGSSRYVAAGGDDTGPGTEARPWRSLAKSAREAVAGDTVYIRAGTYLERLIPANSGRIDAPITFTAYPGEVVTIDGSSLEMSHWGGLVHLERREHICVTGLQIARSKGAGIFAAHCREIRIEGHHTLDTIMPGIMAWDCVEVEIVGNEVERGCMGDDERLGTQECISVAGTERFTVAGNHVHHGFKEGIDAKDGSRHGRIFGNHVHHQKAVGIYIDGWDKHEHDIAVFHNVCHDNKWGIVVASERGGLVERILVYDNLAYRNGMAGFAVAGWGSPETAHPLRDIKVHRNQTWDNRVGVALIGAEGALLQNIEVCNNVVYWNRVQGIALWGEHRKRPEVTMRGVEIVNNTVVLNGTSGTWGSGGIQSFNVKAEGLLIRNNIVSDNKLFTIVVGDPMSPAQAVVECNLIHGFRGASGYSETRGTRSVEGSPRFVDAEKIDFHLTLTSPAVDAGSPEEAAALDFDMIRRPQGNGVDLGAFELVR